QVAERNEIVEIAADRLRGQREHIELEIPHLRHRARKDRLLDAPGVLRKAPQSLRAYLRIDDRPDDPERQEKVLRTGFRMDVERKEIPLLAEGDRREARDAEAL